MILGVLVVLAPVSGLPLSLRAVLEFVLGAAVFLVGLAWRMRDMRRARTAFEPLSVAQPESSMGAAHAEVSKVSESSAPPDPPQMGAF